MEPEQNTELLAGDPTEEAPVARKQCCLIGLKGPEQGAIYRLGPGVTTLGRSAGQADLALLGPGLSRVHARLELRADGTAQVEDLQSTNGTFVNGQRVAVGELRHGDTLALGPEVMFQFEGVPEVMYREATRDGLTGLLNRKAFLQRLAEEHAVARRHGHPSCVAILDADHFKAVNDNHGHPAGDAVLVELARRLEAIVRTEDVVARYGGEEFVVLVRESALDGALGLLERVREAVAASPFPGGLSVTVSIGVAGLVPELAPEAALEQADQALYRAKHGGRNRVEGFLSHPQK